MGDVQLASFVLLAKVTRSTNGLPQARKFLSYMI